MAVHVSGGAAGNPGFTFRGYPTDGLYLATSGVEGQDGVGHAVSGEGKAAVGGTTLFFTPNAGMAYQAPLNDNDHVPGSPAVGKFYFNTSSLSFRFYKGSEWVSLPLVETGLICNYNLTVFADNNLIGYPVNMTASSDNIFTVRKIKLADGSESAPSLSFNATEGFSSTGMYLADSKLCFSYYGSRRLYFGTDIAFETTATKCESTFSLSGTSRIFAPDGTVSSPSYINSSVNGFFLDAGNLCGSISGNRKFCLTSADFTIDTDFEVTGTFSNSSSAAEAFVVNFPSTGYAAVHANGDNDTGIYFDSGGELGILCGGFKALKITSSPSAVEMDEMTISGYLKFGSSVELQTEGSSSSPTLVFGSSTTGICHYKNISDYLTMRFVAEGADVMNLFYELAVPGFATFSNENANSGAADAHDLEVTSVKHYAIGKASYIQGTGIYATGVGAGTISNYLGIDSYGRVYRYYSSEKYKENIMDIDVDYKSIFNLIPVSFTYIRNGQRSFGFIAEDAESFVPWAISYDKEGKVGSFSYKNMIAAVISNVQDFVRRGDVISKKFVFTPGAEPFDPSRAIISLSELKEGRESLDNEIDRLYSRNAALKQRIAAVKALLVAQGR